MESIHFSFVVDALDELARIVDNAQSGDQDAANYGVFRVASLGLELLLAADYASDDAEFVTCGKKLIAKQLKTASQLKAIKANNYSESVALAGSSIATPDVVNSSLAKSSLPRHGLKKQGANQKQEQQAQMLPGFVKQAGKQKKPPEYVGVTNDLIEVFKEVSGLDIPQSLSYPAQNKLWRQPLWEIYDQLYEGDITAAKICISDVVRYMRDSDLTFHNPNSIIRVARSHRAKQKTTRQTGVKGNEEEGFWF